MLGMAVEAEQLLHADRELRPLLRLVVDRHRRAGRRGEMGRRLGVEPALAGPRAAAPASAVGKLVGARPATSAVLPSSSGASHSAALAASAASERSGHSSPSARRRNITRSRHCCSGLLQGSRSRPSRDDAFGELAGGLRRRRRPANGRSASAIAPSRSLRRPRRLARRGVEGDLLAALDLVGEARLDLVERDRRGQQDAALRRGAGQLGDREKRLARQRRGRIDDCAPRPLASRNAPLAAAALGDAVGIGEREDGAGRQLGSSPLRRRPCRRAASSAQRFAIAPRVLAAPRAVAAELIEPMRRDRHRRRRARARTGSRRSRRRAGPAPCARRVDHHAGEPRRQRQLPQLAALVGDAALRVDRAKLGQQRLRLGRARRAGGGSRKASVAGSAAPHCARSSSRPDRSAARISGRA